MPKTITKTVFEYHELSPRAKERARDWFIIADAESGVLTDELMDSLKKLVEHCYGVRLRDWSIGSYGHSYVKVDFTRDEAGELSGPRALAWIENNLLYRLRVPYTGPARWELARFGAYYRAGMIKPCPFTGVCYDDDLLSELLEDIKKGQTLRDAFRGLADTAQKIIQDEENYRSSEEFVAEMMEINGYTFDENGRREG